MSTAKPATVRIVSLDQFRGYTVAGMFLVNFLGGYAVTPILLTHKNTFFSYADTIMPSFMFAAGFSYRLTAVRRLAREGAGATYRKFLVRSLGLILLSLIMYQFDSEIKSWSKLTAMGVWRFIGELIKALNALGVTPRDLVAIIQAIKASGSLKAELVLM